MKRLAAGNSCDHDAQPCVCGMLPEPLDGLAARRLDVMYRAERPSLLRRLARRAGIDQAEDIVQQVFVRLAGRRETIAQIEAPAGYLAEAARNALRDDHRAATRRSTSAHVSLDDVTLPGPDPVSHLEARDRLARLERALGRLKPLTRNVFLARRLDGYSYAEIAEQTGLSVRAVEKQMSRAIQQLARHLDNG
ncbi:RNA polymerase sigma factor [Novosphingobium percolationis]|uniref:RNA polymerase sigma factor n=1 Tax=Novosphingobium percolationis TaxID=2871811 RepID=UPI001CD4165E|nr:sigma-70 family RNA polymerase sigma factor [Novosphingobium percolationis]